MLFKGDTVSTLFGKHTRLMGYRDACPCHRWDRQKTMHIKGCDTPLPMAPVQGKEPFWSPRSQGNPEFWSFRILRLRCVVYLNLYMAVCQNLVPLVNIKIAGKWMFIPLKMVSIGIDPYPHSISGGFFTGRYNDWIPLGSAPIMPSVNTKPSRPSIMEKSLQSEAIFLVQCSYDI